MNIPSRNRPDMIRDRTGLLIIHNRAKKKPLIQSGNMNTATAINAIIKRMIAMSVLCVLRYFIISVCYYIANITNLSEIKKLLAVYFQFIFD